MAATSTINKGLTLKPVHDKVLIKLDYSDKTAGGIILPDSAIDKAGIGTVVAVGQGRRDPEGHLVPMVCQPGDRVMFFAMAGREIKIGGVLHSLVGEPDIDGIVTEEE